MGAIFYLIFVKMGLSHQGVSKNPTFEIQRVPYLIPFHWSREAQNSFCFCSSSSGRPPPLACFCFNGNFNGKMAKNRFFGDKIQQECATTIQLSLLSYIFIALFRDTPLATIGRPWPDGQMAILAIFGHLAIGPCATNSGKWGIPEKSYKNVAQQ